MTIESRPYRRASQGHFTQRLLRTLHALDAELDLSGIAAEFLAESNRRGVLQMCPPNFDDLVKLLGFPIEGFVQAGERGNELLLDGLRRRNVNSSRNDVVAGLAEIHMIVRMDQFAPTSPAQQFGW